MYNIRQVSLNHSWHFALTIHAWLRDITFTIDNSRSAKLIMFDLETLIRRLGNVPHFKGLPETALKEIVISGQILRYSADSSIFSEGTQCSGLFVLFTGRVHLCKLGVQGQETIIAVINPVIMFNEVTVIDGGLNPVTAIAVEDCITWQIGCERFQMLMERYPRMGTGLLRVMATRNRLMLSHIEDLISRPILARVAKSLLDLSQSGHKAINRHRHSNKEIASRVATVHEAVSRSIKSLQDSGAIEYTRDEISVISIERLAELAQIRPLELEPDA